ncbi:flavonol 3-O-glucosyltransferase F3GT2-like [Cornus florida]|uniref:flavonol 3-O-glucosyltransferase F3GT2-like n=1 Tax=Cornus florida TaxID=4283 RepID=UPI00289DCED5|nr:flavonol 3-O-glucosyltransferase F3GT2-like [Cornus florida]
MASHYSSGAEQHIAILAFPFGTHAAPLLTLVRSLAAACAPNVRFSFFSTAKSNASIFSGSKPSDEFHNIRAYNVWDGMPKGHALATGIDPHQQVQFFLMAIPDNFNNAIKEAEEESGVKISCLLTDAFLWFAGEMAEEKRIPWLPFWTAGACSLSSHLHVHLIRSTLLGTSGIADNAYQTLNFIPGMSGMQISDLPEGIVSGNLESPIALMLENMGLKLPQATAVVLNSFEELDPTITGDLKSKLPKVLNVSPLIFLSSPPTTISDESSCLLWLDGHKTASVAYISFGTITTPPQNELVALSEALEASGVPFLFSLRDNSRHLLPEGFLERTRKSTTGKVVSWAPQLQVLEHTSVGAFVTHCGWNSILEGITSGVPMICRPFFGDQKLNSGMVENVWQIGVRIEGGVFTKSGMVNALHIIFSDARGKKMRENIGVLKENAKKAVGTNGSSTDNFKSLVEIVTSCKS